jgi:hypothetical protein
MDKPIITLDDHDAGFKDLDLTLRSGRTERVRIRALPWREACEVCTLMAAGGGLELLVRRSLPADKPATFMDRLTPQSAALVEFCALALAFGEDVQKKMLEMGNLFLGAMATTTPGAPNSPASAGVSAPPTCDAGVFQG